MRKLLIGFGLFLFLGCVSTTNTVVKPKITLHNECRENANCKIEIFDNKTLVVKQDEFGANYYTIENDPQKKVIKYSYSKIVKGNIQDAGYREEIVFELNDLSNQEFIDGNLQKTQMLFGRFCYCKGQTGNYKVKAGQLSVKNTTVTLNFTVPEVPQIIKNISFDIK